MWGTVDMNFPTCPPSLASMNFGWFSLDRSGKAFARQSAVSAEVFLDRDNDGLFGPNDEAIEGAGFTGSSIPKDTITEKDGSAFVIGLEPYNAVQTGVNVAPLQDSFWAPANPLKSVVMRPGTSTKYYSLSLKPGKWTVWSC